ncbi:MAG: DUF5688 family protein [Clostridiales bacterium]|nr:DUF5688 family protein [Clostridiales bacterium]
MKNYNEFKTLILMKLDADIPEPKDIQTTKVQRLNGCPEEAVLVMENGVNAAPTIYLERFYKEYESSGDFDAVYKKILDLHMSCRLDKPMDVKAITEFDRAKDFIVLRLINRKNNTDLLETAPYIKFLDLAIVFYIVIRDTEKGEMASVKVSNYLLDDIWGKTVDDIYPIALENTERLFPLELMNMGSILELATGTPVPEGPPVKVMTNNKGMFGAIALYFKDKIREVAEGCGSDMYILPSSIHEILLCPVVVSPEIKDMTEMVQEVNRTVVDVSEILSDHAYLYKLETDEIVF